MKKIISLFLALVIALGCGSAVYATNETVVKYEEPKTYSISIPEYIVPQDVDEDANASAYQVTASGVQLAPNEALSIIVSYSGIMSEDNGVELPYRLFTESGDLENGGVMTTKEAGSPDTSITAYFGAQNLEKPNYAGVYLDTAVFSVNVSPVRGEISAEEIEANPLLFGIGKTKPEYVIAEFNEDFTHVDIYKNGENSDGLSKDFVSPTADKTYPIYNNRATLKTVTVEEGVVGLGGNAFAMTNITSITLPQSLREIGVGCFNACKSLTGFVIPDGVKTLGKAAFNNCTAAASELKLPSSLENLGDQVFNGDKKLTGSIVIPSRVTSIGKLCFQNCSGLKGTLELNKNLQTIGTQAFYGCSGLTGDIVIPDNVTTIGQYAFGSDTGFTGKLVLGDSVKTIEPYAFSGCSKVTGGITTPKSLEKIGAFAFQSMYGLNGDLTLNEGLLYIGDGAFNQCQNMSNKSLAIPGSVTTIGGDTSYEVTEDAVLSSGFAEENTGIGSHVFFNFATSTLQSYEVNGGVSFKAVDGVLFSADGTRLLAYPASKEGATYTIPEGVTVIDELAFGRPVNGSASEKLKTLILPNSYVIKTTNQAENILNRGNGNSLAVALYTHTSVTDVQVKSDNPNYKSVDGCVYSKDGTTLFYVPVAKSGTLNIADGTKTIMFGALYGFEKAAEHPNSGSLFTNLTSVNIPASVNGIYNITLTRLNAFLTAGRSVTIADGNSALTIENGKIKALTPVLGSDGWVEI